MVRETNMTEFTDILEDSVISSQLNVGSMTISVASNDELGKFVGISTCNEEYILIST